MTSKHPKYVFTSSIDTKIVEHLTFINIWKGRTTLLICRVPENRIPLNAIPEGSRPVDSLWEATPEAQCGGKWMHLVEGTRWNKILLINKPSCKVNNWFNKIKGGCWYVTTYQCRTDGWCRQGAWIPFRNRNWRHRGCLGSDRSRTSLGRWSTRQCLHKNICNIPTL